MNYLELISHSPEQTQKLGTRIGELARPGDVFLLVGDLGTGKTCLTQGIAWGLDIEEYALSPTFVIVRELRGRLPLYHIDLYRIETPEAFASLGLDECLAGDGVAAIEWAEHGWGCLPKEMLTFRLQHTGSDTRTVEIVPEGDRYIRLVQALTDDFLAASGCFEAKA